MSKTISLILVAMILAACKANQATPTPTLSVESIQTQVVGTFAAGLTQTAVALPTSTPTLTPTETPTVTPTRATPLTPGNGGAPTASCYGLTGIKEVTIPDNTPMVPGQTFTKTWLVKNTGTCTWEAGFKFAFIGGDAMGGSTLALSTAVSPGAEVELSVDMVAPNKTGAVRGNWRMSTASGQFFGEEQFVIIVLGNATSTATGTPTATATPTVTSEPPTPTETLTPTETVP